MQEQPAIAADLIELSAVIVRAYVGHNAVRPDDLAALIADVHRALNALDTPLAPSVEPRPAVSIRKSVRPDAITCLEDGKAFKSMKRHLRAHHDMSPQQYRERWDLPASYPMVAPDYSARRSSLARANGLGKTARTGKAVRRRAAKP